MSGKDTAGYEEEHVHQVYHQIASHFSSTRHKPWPVVDEFLRSQRSGSIGLDLGCGNGKYLTVNKDVFIIASDRSLALVNIARQHQPHAGIVADTLHIPHPDSIFDFAISIAVIHHLSTDARRTEAVHSILQTIKPSSPSKPDAGQALIFVWALEQKNSRRGWDEGDQQDVLVPWVMKEMPGQDSGSAQERTYQRYYHLFRKGELERLVVSAGGTVVRSGYDRDNWWAIASRKC